MVRSNIELPCEWSIGCCDEYESHNAVKRWDPDSPTAILAAPVRSVRLKYTARKGPTMLNFVRTVKPQQPKPTPCTLTPAQRAVRDYGRAMRAISSIDAEKLKLAIANSHFSYYPWSEA